MRTADHALIQHPARFSPVYGAANHRSKELTMSDKFDVIVIGAGPAGYRGRDPRRAARPEDRLRRCLAGKDGKPALGGTCLNVGCIPSKALLDSSRQFHNLTHNFEEHGISADNAKIDVATMVGRKDKIVKQFTGGIAHAVQGATRSRRSSASASC